MFYWPFEQLKSTFYIWIRIILNRIGIQMLQLELKRIRTKQWLPSDKTTKKGVKEAQKTPFKQWRGFGSKFGRGRKFYHHPDPVQAAPDL